jgi:putative lipoprotein
MNPIVPVLLTFRLTFSGVAPVPEAPDRWFGEDKVQHFLLSFAVTNLSYGTARLVGMDHSPAQVTAGITAGAAGIGKEIYDRSTGGHFSFKDLAWDGAGIAAGITLISHAR